MLSRPWKNAKWKLLKDLTCCVHNDLPCVFSL